MNKNQVWQLVSLILILAGTYFFAHSIQEAKNSTVSFNVMTDAKGNVISQDALMEENKTNSALGWILTLVGTFIQGFLIFTYLDKKK